MTRLIYNDDIVQWSRSVVMSNSMVSSRRESPGLIIVGILWIASYFGARVLLDTSIAEWLLVLVAVIPVIPFAVFLLLFIRSIRSADEMERRIHLEALAVAFPLAVLLMMILGLLQLAVDLSMDDWSYRHLWPIVVIFYLLGLTLARRRYQ
jgi:hypothetical protein